MITPLLEKDADGIIKDRYTAIKKTLISNTLPSIFSYIGAFPDYFLYLCDQLIVNLDDSRFKLLAAETADSVFSIIKSLLEYSENK